MPGFQGSFEDRIGKFKAGNDLVQSFLDYDPNNPFILKAALTSLISDVEAAITSSTARRSRARES